MSPKYFAPREFDRQVDYVLDYFRRALDKAKTDPLAPAGSSSDVTDYLIELEREFNQGCPDLYKFTVLQDHDDFTLAVLMQTIPADLRSKFQHHRRVYDELQSTKLDHLDKHEFEFAARCKQEQIQIVQSARNLLDHNELAVRPCNIRMAAESLGYAGPFPLWQ